MKKILPIIALILFLVPSCRTIEDKIRIEQECSRLDSRLYSLREKERELSAKVDNAEKDLKSLLSCANDHREPKYIVKFQIKQGTFTLDIFAHIKNEINAIEVEIPVSKDYYDRLTIGQDITNAFKYGSLVINGDFSTLHMRVAGKRIE